MIAILDFGSQYTQLVARHVREQQTYCEIYPYNISIDRLKNVEPKGIILSGGPASVYGKNAPLPDKRIFELDIPILGICYGMQLIVHLASDGSVEPATHREYGEAKLELELENDLLRGVDKNLQVWMSHGDQVSEMPTNFELLAHTTNSPIAAIADRKRKIFALQFHPEVVNTRDNGKILSNFVHSICGSAGDWSMSSFLEPAIERIRYDVGEQNLICGVSGGVDSTVLAVLLERAIGDRLSCIFIDNGLLRQNEAENVMAIFDQLGVKVKVVPAGNRFLDALRGVTDAEEKRKRIGHTFIEVFKDSIGELGEITFLAQGTLYPDVVESLSQEGLSATIKTHHNVGGLPKDMPFKLIEPFRELFKDEVRKLGRELEIPEAILGRHPFPGPGLAVRILGEVTLDRLELLRKADKIFISELRSENLYDEVWQALTVLLPIRTVGVMGDERTYENVVSIRAVTSTDGMTADWAKLPHRFLAKISNRIINEVPGINRVVYDISSKPPSTIEWE